METKKLDIVLVPCGVAIMVVYHLWLLYRICCHPTETIVGINAIHRRIWIQTMMENISKNGIVAVQTIRNNLMASTLMATTAIMLSSLIVVLMTSTGAGLHNESFVLGDTAQLRLSIKLFSILVCFLLAFLLYVQSIRYYSHATILLNVPTRSRFGTKYASQAMNRGSYFWSLGLRAYYFSFPLVMWVFGPVPMLVCCCVMVSLLYFLDFYSGWGVDDVVEAEESIASKC